MSTERNIPRPDLVPSPYDKGDPRVVPPMFRLGSDAVNSEVFIEGRRILWWKLTGQEDVTARIAGWDKLLPEDGTGLSDKEIGHILVPTGTRNARSVLSGEEAWEGEKATVMSAAIQYQNDIHEVFGTYDTDFSWSAMGITPDQKIFVAPPNLINPETSNGDVRVWQAGLTQELDILLRGDEQNRELVKSFAQTLKG